MRFVRALERITAAVAAIGAAFILPLVAAMIFEVVSRLVFGAPTAWAYETSYMMMAAIFMMGIAYALKRRDHVSVDLVYGVLAPRYKAMINILGYGLLLPCVVWLTYALFNFALQAFRTGELTGQSAWNPVVWPYRTVLVVGFAVFALQVVAELIKSVRVLITNDPRGLEA